MANYPFDKAETLPMIPERDMPATVDTISLLAADFEPYLDAAFCEAASGNRDFDENVTGIRSLALFLAQRAIEIRGKQES